MSLADDGPRKPSPKPSQEPLKEGLDYYVEDGKWVFTSHFLLKRGYCCDSRCRHCPYENTEKNKGTA